MFSMNDSPIYERLGADLEQRKKGNLFRTPGISGKGVRIDLSTNSYLALHENAEVITEAEKLAASGISIPAAFFEHSLNV